MTFRLNGPTADECSVKKIKLKYIDNTEKTVIYCRNVMIIHFILATCVLLFFMMCRLENCIDGNISKMKY